MISHIDRYLTYIHPYRLKLTPDPSQTTRPQLQPTGKYEYGCDALSQRKSESLSSGLLLRLLLI